MTIEELERLMQIPEEHETLEFKAARTGFHSDKVMDYCVALSNEGGGKLILGVSDDHPRKVVGTTAANHPAGMQKKILDTLHFLVRVEELAHPDGRVVIFHIPSRDLGAPRSHKGSFLMRSGEELKAMTTERLREIFDEGKPDWLMQTARKGCVASDVVTLLDTQSYYDLLTLPYPSERIEVLYRFQQEGLISRAGGSYSITNLGAILFAKRLSDFEGLARKAPRVIAYEGSSKLAESRLFKPGVRGYAIGFEGLIDFISAQIPTNELVGKALRTEVKMFPEVMIRELVANALIHQDFTETGTSVTIELYSDRLEVSNPGRSVISPERFIDSYKSRNEKLADLMRRLGMCEEQGLGIDRVIRSAEVMQLPAPDFRQGDRSTIAVVFAHKAFDEMDRQDRVRACFQHCVLRYLMNQKMNNQSLRERFDLPDSKTELVSGIIADAIQQNRIKPDNPANTSRRYAKYIPHWA
jgi:ATP-dependent DNA helicase RecG